MTLEEKPTGDAPGNLLRRWVGLNLVLLILVGLFSLTYPVEELSRRLQDEYFRLRGTQSTSSNVVLVLIDDASLSQYGRWPWPRPLLARLIRAASAQRPRVIGVDIILSEPSQAKNEDQELADVVRTAGNVVLATKISSAPKGEMWVEPLPLFADGAAGVGHVQAVLGPDGICRSVPAAEMTTTGPRPAFALEVARVAQGHSLIGVPGKEAADTRSPSPGIAAAEVLAPRFLLVDFRGQVLPEKSSSPFASVSAADLLQGQDGDQLRNKTVLIGFAAAGISDRFPTPVSDRLLMPGVEINANVVDGLLAGRDLRPLGTGTQILLLIAASLVLTWMLLRWPGVIGIVLLGAFTVAAYWGGYLLFVHAQRLLAFGPFLCLSLLAAPLAELQSLVAVDRSLTRSLRHLQSTLQTTSATMGEGLRLLVRSEEPASTADLHWKVAIINQLQAELSSLYTFEQTLLDYMQEGLAVFAPDGKLLFQNPQWDRFCETLPWESTASLEEFSVALGLPDWRERLREPGSRLEAELLRNNSLWQLRVLRLPSLAHAGIGALMVVVTDLTARHERDRARAEALRFVTHELRTPLVSIQGYAEFLLRYPRAADSSQAVETIFRESKRLVAMTNTYLDVLRLESGARPLRNEVVDIPGSLSQLQRVMQPLAQAADMNVEVEVNAALPVLRGDTDLIAGALLNLLSNAVKYGERGSQVKLRAFGRNDQLVFEVWNQGPPISQENLGHLFEPFYRAAEQETLKPGWGLGLSFVKRIAEGHGGRVEASSDAEAGTCFRILLPCAPALTAELTA